MRRCQKQGTVMAIDRRRMVHFLARANCSSEDGSLVSPVIFYTACNLATQAPLLGEISPLFYYFRRGTQGVWQCGNARAMDRTVVPRRMTLHGMPGILGANVAAVIGGVDNPFRDVLADFLA